MDAVQEFDAPPHFVNSHQQSHLEQEVPSRSTSSGHLQPDADRRGLCGSIVSSRRDIDSCEAPLLPNGPNRSFWKPIRLAERGRRLMERFLPKGWRFGATLAGICSALVLISNIAAASLSRTTLRSAGSSSTITPILTGSCSSIERTSIRVHLAINVASTLLLSGSNYCMQCISAPTRSDIDKAHQDGRWLDIGVPSLRNLRYMGARRLMLWLLLGLSSIPLHLVYNSTFFMSRTHNDEYGLYFASDSFANGAPFDDIFWREETKNLTVEFFDQTLYDQPYHVILPDSSLFGNISSIQANASAYERLEKTDCITAYAKRILPDRKNVVLVTSNSPYDDSGVFNAGFGNRCRDPDADIIASGHNVYLNFSTCQKNSSLFAVGTWYHGLESSSGEPFSWICSSSSGCDSDRFKSVKANNATWTVFGYQVQYCLSQKVYNQCSLNVAWSLLVVVIIFNACKFLSIVLTFLTLRDKPLITIGDAVESFLMQPDPCTSGRHLLTKDNVRRRTTRHRTATKAFDPFKKQRLLWGGAASKTRWLVAMILALIALAAVLGLLIFSVSAFKKTGISSMQDIWGFGLGTVDPRALIGGWDIPVVGDSATLKSILVANTPQLILSLIYTVLNSIFTSMSLAVEWSQYYYKSRTLRVSHQKGEQRSTYFLQIPYRLGIPVMLFFMVLHWLISQSLFLAKIDNASSGMPMITTCGFSPPGILSTIICGTALVTFAVILGTMTLRPGMPLVGSCSLAISAACHALESTSATLPLKWGAISLDESDKANEAMGSFAFYNPPDASAQE